MNIVSCKQIHKVLLEKRMTLDFYLFIYLFPFYRSSILLPCNFLAQPQKLHVGFVL